jgi:hypothetical protein
MIPQLATLLLARQVKQLFLWLEDTSFAHDEAPRVAYDTYGDGSPALPKSTTTP